MSSAGRARRRARTTVNPPRPLSRTIMGREAADAGMSAVPGKNGGSVVRRDRVAPNASAASRLRRGHDGPRAERCAEAATVSFGLSDFDVREPHYLLDNRGAR